MYICFLVSVFVASFAIKIKKKEHRHA